MDMKKEDSIIRIQLRSIAQSEAAAHWNNPLAAMISNGVLLLMQ